jgi:hypothetical protein
MRKLIIIIILSLIPAACEWEYGYEVEIGEITDYNFENDIPEFENPVQAAYWLKKNIVYVSDYVQFKIDYIQTPEELYNNRDEKNFMKGDCDDFITKFCYIIDIQFPELSNFFVSVKFPDEKYSHALAYVDGLYYDITADKGYIIPLSALRDNIKINYSIPYHELIWMVVNYHEISFKCTKLQQ